MQNFYQKNFRIYLQLKKEKSYHCTMNQMPIVQTLPLYSK